MATRVIGLDVGTNAVRAVEVQLREPVRLLAMGQVGLPAGAVVGGEIVDVAAVADALRRLWDEVGFRNRTVRVAMSSARVIVRTIEMPRLPRADLLSALRLQLDEYVPFAPDETVFDARLLDGVDAGGQTQQVLFAATHQDAARQLVHALQAADLHVAAVDVVPAALALALTRPEPDDDGESVDVLVSIGAGTVVVVAGRGGEPLSSRILSNVSGRTITDGIASHLSVSHDEAERYKRSRDDAMSSVAVLAAAPSLEQVIDEVCDSVAFYSAQPDARPVRQVCLTGGGVLLPGLASALAERLDVHVRLADPFEHVELGSTGFEAGDLPYLAPYMAAALGAALGASRSKGRFIDLTPARDGARRAPAGRRVLAAVGAVAVLGVGGAVYQHGRSALADERQNLSSAKAILVELQSQAKVRAPTDPAAVTASEANPAAVAASVTPRRVDWLGVEQAIEALAGSFAMTVSSFDGVLHPVAVRAAAPVVTVPTAGAGQSETGGGVETATTTAAPAAGRNPATLTLAVTAPSLGAVADWLDALAADPRYDDPVVGGLTISTAADGTKSVQFTTTVELTVENLVATTPSTVPA